VRLYFKVLLLLLVSALFTPKLCLAVEVQLTSDTQRLQLGEAMGIYLSVVGATVESQPVIPEVDGLTIQLSGHRNSSVNLNGRRSRTVTFTYLVRTSITGSITIPGFTVATSNGQYVSNEITIDVAEPDGSSSGLQAGFDSQEMWEGQTVVYGVRFETLERVLQWGWTPPDLIGFAPEQIVPEFNREFELDRNGERVKVLEISTPLVAIRAGARDVSPGVVTVEVSAEQKRGRRRSMFTQTRRDVYPSEPSTVSVYPLPEEGRRQDFSGLVGEFWIEASLSQESVSLGESVTLSVRITGTGTLAGFVLPEVSDELFQTYDQAGQLFGGVQGGDFQTTGVFQRAIVPSAAGELIIPQLVIQVFSPEAGDFVDVSTGEFSLMVLPGEQVEHVQGFGDGDAPSGVAIQGEDILPIHTEASLGSSFVLKVKPAVVLALTPWLFVVLSVLSSKLGGRTPSKRLAVKAMIKAAKSGDMVAVEAAFRAAIAFEVGCTPSALTLEMLDSLPVQFRERAIQIYSEITGARYGGEGATTADALQLASDLLEPR
jgi:hypothetical protein